MPEEEGHKEQIVNLLRKNPQGLTNTDIKKHLKLSPYVIAIELAKLEGAEKLEVRKIGKARLNYLREWKQSYLH